MSFFFGAPAPTPPTPGVSNTPAGGGGIYFPRYFNKTLLHQQLYRNFVGRPAVSPDLIGVDQNIVPLSSFFLFPNDIDLCLHREWYLFDNIDPNALSCARKPECFCGAAELEWVEPPPGSRVFNPSGGIPLPNTTDENVIVLRFRVPVGYDGIITAQYNEFTQPWTEGSGDLVWRVRVDGRYLRDCGNILFTLGSSVDLSPIYGGLQLRSGNLVEYVVSAPNTSGSLPLPGVGNILAGLHGWFYPRN